MKSGSKLDEFADKYNDSFFDVGIAEEHATVMAAGLASSNKDVVLLMYSTFAQRAYDYILNDIARTDLKVVFGLDRAGVVGEDGSTHQGIYDVSMLSGMPNIRICAPSNACEVVELFNYAIECETHPIVIRYPRANTHYNPQEIDFSKVGSLDWKVLKEGSKVAEVYKTTQISERHRHRYEVNIKYKSQLAQGGMIISGTSPDGKLPEIVERLDHPWFIGVQFHPELKSRPFAPHPLFVEFVKASINQSRLV
jgi:deoxyxylulose-5-phosphate synthase